MTNQLEYVGQAPLTSLEQIDRKIEQILKADIADESGTHITSACNVKIMNVLNYQVKNKQLALAWIDNNQLRSDSPRFIVDELKFRDYCNTIKRKVYNEQHRKVFEGKTANIAKNGTVIAVSERKKLNIKHKM